MAYKDNRFLDAEYIKVLEGLRDKDETYYQVYVWACGSAAKSYLQKLGGGGDPC
jgi:hypothetical protein